MSTYLGTDGKEHRFLQLEEIKARYMEGDETLEKEMEEFFMTYTTGRLNKDGIPEDIQLYEATVKKMDRFIVEGEFFSESAKYIDLWKSVKKILRKRLRKMKSNKQ